MRANVEMQKGCLMEPSPRQESDATSARPDGYITIVFRDPATSNVQCFFEGIETWYWKKYEDMGQILVVKVNDGHRREFPAINIMYVDVKGNSKVYVAQQEMEEAARHVLELQHHLDQAEAKFDEKRRTWHATS